VVIIYHYFDTGRIKENINYDANIMIVVFFGNKRNNSGKYKEQKNF